MGYNLSGGERETFEEDIPRTRCSKGLMAQLNEAIRIENVQREAAAKGKRFRKVTHADFVRAALKVFLLEFMRSAHETSESEKKEQDE